MAAAKTLTRQFSYLEGAKGKAMSARDVMTRRVAVPVVDEEWKPIGMVSEGDLIGRDEPDREARRDWWLTLLAEGETLSPDSLPAYALRTEEEERSW
jgi:hypothetical protein